MKSTKYERYRIEKFIDESPNISDFLQRLNSDVNSHILLYLGIFAVFIVWGLFRALRIRWQYKRDKETSDRLETAIKAHSEKIEQLASSFDTLVEHIGQLAKEIRKDRESRHGSPPTDM